jgi:hypothetical protein
MHQLFPVTEKTTDARLKTSARETVKPERPADGRLKKTPQYAPKKLK